MHASLSPRGGRPRWSAAVLGSALAFGLAVLSVRAGAQPADEQVDLTKNRDEARRLAEEGVAALDRGEAERGVALLERAESKFHAPTHWLYLARGYERLGKLGLSAETYERLVGESLPNYAPDAFREAQRLGGEELASLRPRLGRVVVVLRGASTEGATVAVDHHAPMPWLDVVSLEAGRHDLVVTVGNDSRTATIAIADREEQKLEISFVSQPTSKDGSMVVTHPFVVPAIISFVVGGAALIAGTATGVLSLDAVSDLESKCPQKVGCDPRDEPLANDARRLGDVSTAMFVLGGAGAITGLVLALVPVRKPGKTSSGTRGPSIDAFVGLGEAGLRGEF